MCTTVVLSPLPTDKGETTTAPWPLWLFPIGAVVVSPLSPDKGETTTAPTPGLFSIGVFVVFDVFVDRFQQFRPVHVAH